MRYKYVYSYYWRRWSRVLDQDGIWITEVNITGIGNNWDDVRPIIIRKHCTARNRLDRFSNDLPIEIVQQMREYLGVDLTESLMNEDFLSQIDWDKYEEHNNGGAPLYLIGKDHGE